MHLTATEHGGYFLLMMAYWKHGGPLPYDEQNLKECTKLTRKGERNSFKKVLTFFALSDGMIHHSRIDKELQTVENIRESKSRAGKKGMAARWHKDNSVITDPITKDNPSPSPSPEEKKKSVLRNTPKEKSGSSEPSPLFVEFWNIYPARNGKKLEKAVTEKAFLKLSVADQATCITAGRHYAKSEQAQEGIGIKDPKRFLLNGFWREWIEPEQLDERTGKSRRSDIETINKKRVEEALAKRK